MFFKTGALKNFAIFIEKHRCWSLLKKLQTWRPAKRPQRRWFHVNIAEFLWTTFLQNTSIGCFCCFKKFVNFPVKHQWCRPNVFNKYNWIRSDVNLLKLVDILDIYITWVIFQQFSHRDLKPVAFLVLLFFHSICRTYVKNSSPVYSKLFQDFWTWGDWHLGLASSHRNRRRQSAMPS